MATVGVKWLTPRTNIITDCMAGRLLRAYNVEFNWFKLSSWINVTEQWPYRLSWIILEVEDNPDIDDPLSLKNVYDRSSVLSVNHSRPVSRICGYLIQLYKSRWIFTAPQNLAAG